MRNREDGTEIMGLGSKDYTSDTGHVAFEVPMGCLMSDTKTWKV